MTTLNEMIAIIKTENPNGLRTGSDEVGYTEVSPTDYETIVKDWAQARLDDEAKAQAEAKDQADKTGATTKLLALGLNEADLIAMGLMPKPVEPA